MEGRERSRTCAKPLVRHHIAGGTESGGGIGRLIGYVLDAIGTGTDSDFEHKVVDTRGTSWRSPRAPLRFLAAFGLIAGDAFCGRIVLQQFHIAGRGSTVRKLLLSRWARLLRAPYVLHLHDYAYEEDFERRPPWQQKMIRAMFQQAEQIFVLGQRDLGTVWRSLEVPTASITILRNCVPDPGPRIARVHPQTNILFLGRLGPRKGVPELIEALSGPGLRHASWCATLAGDGMVTQYRDELAQLGLSDHVHLPGWVSTEAASELRSKADILVLPSHAEGFAMAVLEGLAAGLAVITTRVGAHGEVLIDGENCLLVPPGDAEALACALKRLIDDDALRERLAEAGRKLYLSRFGMADYVTALEASLGDLVNDAATEARST